MKKKPEQLLDMQCKRCGQVTHHYLSVNGETGEYKCVRCQTVNKTIKVKPQNKVVFNMDEEFEAELNEHPVDGDVISVTDVKPTTVTSEV